MGSRSLKGIDDVGREQGAGAANVGEVIGQRKIEVLDELLSDDFVEHETMPGVPPGREGVKALIGMFLSAFPDMQFELGDIVADGDVVASRMTMTGRIRGSSWASRRRADRSM